MRVITGTAKGHKLKMPKGGKTRPAMDRVKASLFSILGNMVLDCRFLDLFAGTGSLGIEALSRGAAYAAFVDRSSECVRTINENLRITHLQEKGEVFGYDCTKFLKQKVCKPFSIVCIDPPYLKGLLEPILELIPACELFTPDTLFIIERQKKDSLGMDTRESLRLLDERSFGDTILTFFKTKP